MIAAVALGWLLFVHLPERRQEELATWSDRLAAVADARRAAIERWVAERIGDARRVAGYPTTLYLLTGRQGPPYPFPEPQGPAAHLRDVLAMARGVSDVSAVWVLTRDLDVAVASPDAPELTPDCLAAAAAALDDPSPVVALHRHADGSVAVAVAVAISDDRAPPQFAAIGVAVVTADPGRWLYPMLSEEWSGTRSGEALLAREGRDGVVFLSPVRHGAQAFAPGSRSEAHGLAAKAAVSGIDGVGEYVDYRGEAILAATRRIAGADWGLVVKVDRSEALAPFAAYRTALLVQIVLGLLALAAAGGAWQRHQRARTLAAVAAGHAERAALLDQANDAILFVDPDGRILEANRRAETMYGRPAAELTGMSVADLSSERCRQDVAGHLAAALARGVVFETVHLRGDGSKLQVEVSSRSVRRGGADILISIVRDISERKAAEARIRDLDRLLRTISEVNQLIVREDDPKTLLDAACSILVEHGGYHLAWIGLETEDGRVARAAAARAASSVPAVIDETGTGRGPTEAALDEAEPVVVGDWLTDERFPDDQRAVIDAGIRSSCAVALGSGGHRGVLAVAHAEPAAFGNEARSLLQELAGDLAYALSNIDVAARLRAIVDGAPVAVFTLTLDGVVTMWNPAAERIFGWSHAEAVGRILPIVPDEKGPEFTRLRQRVAAGEWFSGVELERRRKDGSDIRISLSTAPLRSADGAVNGILAIAADVTAERLAEERLQHAQKMETVGRLAGGIAHDFNNLLQIMVAQVEMLALCPDDPAAFDAARTELADAVRRGASLTRQLLLFSRREAARIEDVDVAVLVRESGRLLRRLLRETVRLTVVAENGPVVVRGDRGQLEQVVLNLAVNAADAVSDGGEVVLRTRHAPDRTVAIEVEDDGPGIPPELREAVFEPFFTTKKAGEGTGLGLAVVHGIATGLQGRVEIRDGAAGGALVRVVLPASPDSAGHRDEDAPRGRSLPDAARGLRVLLVEDQEQARAVFERFLARLGLEVSAAANVAEAEAAAEAAPPDLLLADLGLPDGSGADLAATLVRRIPGLRAILMSGYAPPDALPANLAGANTVFLQKPFDLKTLAEAVRETFEHGQSPST